MNTISLSVACVDYHNCIVSDKTNKGHQSLHRNVAILDGEPGNVGVVA